MQFTSLLIATAAFALAQAKVILTNTDFALITAGQPFTVKWSNATGPVALILRGAQPGAKVTDPANLFSVYTIDSNLQGSQYVWNVPANTPQSTYAIEIQDSKDTNYSNLWEVIKGVPATTLVSGSFTGTRTASGSATGSASGNLTSTGAETASATGSNTRTDTTSATRTAASTSASVSATTAPAGGMAASGVTSNLALVFGAAAALIMLN